MTNKKIIYLLFSLSLVLSSCSEDFLNEPKPTDEVSDDVVFGSKTGAEAFLSGIHRNMRGQFIRTDAAGVNSYYMARTVKGNDIIQNSWYNFDYENDNREPNYTRTNFSWQYAYFMINQANTFINGVEETDAISDEDKLYLIGSGKAIRGYFYFQLALEFQATYVGNEDADAPPIYLETTQEGKPMTTMSALYDQITSDLEYAVENLDSYRLGKSYFNQAAAAGILTRVYQTMQNWSGVEQMANLAWGGGSPQAAMSPELYGDGFDKLNNPEWIWGYAQTGDQSNYYYGAPHAFFDHFTESYQGSWVNQEFADSFSDTDVRSLFVEGFYSGGVSNPLAWNNVVTTKFTFNFDSDYAIIRTPEMILAEAEAKFHLSNETEAHNLLFAVQSNRDPNAVKSSNTGQDLLDEILYERRKELYGEIGVEWFDAKRYGKGIPRTGNHRLGPSTALMPNDPKFYLKIPQAEIDANENIDDSVNAGR